MAKATAVRTSTTHDVLRRVTDRTMLYDFTVWFWGDAIAMDGLLDAAELLDDPLPSRHCLRFYESWAAHPLGWVDHLTPGAALLRVYQAERKRELLDAAHRLAAWITDRVPRSSTGAALYRPDLPPYRHSVWVDTIYHVPPFLSRLAQVTGDGRFHDDALDVWTSHVSLLADKRSHLLAHSYDTGALLTRGHGWGRGNGWALYGMVDTLEVVPADHPRRAGALKSFQELCAAVLTLQDASGFWRTLLHDREAYLESSTAAFFGALFTKAVRLGLLGHAYAQAAERAWHAMLSRIDREGNLYGVSACTYASTLPDDDLVMYRTLPTEVNVWGQGSALRFAAERIRAGLD
jgi:unsaturated rhamnogalacturonyl hydrolase